MATPFESVAFDPSACRVELAAFSGLLASKAELSERDDILPFFKRCRQLSALLGTFEPAVGLATVVRHEFSFVGDYSADLVVGNSTAGSYLAVEFEDAGKNSIFKNVRGRSLPSWSPRFDHGYSQLIDWFYTIEDYRQTAKFRTEFGEGDISFAGLLVAGRNAGLTDAERRRLKWRSRKVLVDSCRINCVTFDDLCQSLSDKLQIFISPVV